MYKNFFKRVLDIFGALSALPLVIIIVAVFAPFIYFSDHGPIFYNVLRIGRNGKLFKMFKLRSMIVNAPDFRLADGSTYNSIDDPRVTKIGRFIRKTSIDELPQFINVLIGNMSLVGPRPDTSLGAHRYPEEEKYFLQVKPGITGYSQAYFRNSADGKQKAVDDMYYAKNVCFILDMKIFFRTITTVILRRNINKNEHASCIKDTIKDKK